MGRWKGSKVNEVKLFRGFIFGDHFSTFMFFLLIKFLLKSEYKVVRTIEPFCNNKHKFFHVRGCIGIILI